MQQTKPDPNDRPYWLEHGRSIETAFCETIAPKFGLWAAVNPEKGKQPTLPDLLFRGELKSISTPLFKAQSLYGLNPQYAMTFNLKDLDYYLQCYPDLIVAFHVHWQTTSAVIGGSKYQVEPMEGVWRASIPFLEKICKDAPVLQYQQRVSDRQNAKASYVFQVDRLQCLGVKIG